MRYVLFFAEAWLVATLFMAAGVSFAQRGSTRFKRALT